MTGDQKLGKRLTRSILGKCTTKGKGDTMAIKKVRENGPLTGKTKKRRGKEKERIKKENIAAWQPKEDKGPYSRRGHRIQPSG